MASLTIRAVQALGAKTLLGRFWAREVAVGAAQNATQTKKASAAKFTSLPNPFLPRLNEETGRWRPPRYSRRRQAELVKSARLLGVEALLPQGPKGQRPLGGTPQPPMRMGMFEKELTEHAVRWVGKPAPINKKGLYGNRRLMFKGHKWERERPAREEALHNFKVNDEQKKRVLSSRLKRLDRKAERERTRGGILI